MKYYLLVAMAMLAAAAQAQSLQTLFSFTNGPANPQGGLTLGPDGNLYGTTYLGGNSNCGTIFRVTTNGTMTTLANFTVTNGAYPKAALTLGPDGNFYGTTSASDNSSSGTIFQLTTNGVLTTLTNFVLSNGGKPNTSLTLAPDGTFYGVTDQGNAGYGELFQVTTNGALTNLVTFGIQAHHSSLTVAPNGILWGTVSAYNTMAYGAVSREYIVGGKFTYQQQTYFFTNSAATNGVTPYGGVTLGLDGNFYGTTSAGGSSNYGTVFQEKTNGTFTSLMSFTSPTGPVNPQVGLTLGPDGNLYGVTQYGGSSNYGTVFQVTTNGVLTTLASFTFDNGAYPVASLTLGPDGNLYGTTPVGGSGFGGTVFQITTNGALTTLVNFTLYGTNPQGGLTLAPDGNLYGTTYLGGNSNCGTIFRVTTNGALTVLTSFATTNGAYPEAAMTLGPDGNFYGTTSASDNSSSGTIFQLTTNGVLTTLTNFVLSNGGKPNTSLTLAPDGTFYGVTDQGSGGHGELFQVTTNGTLTNLVGLNMGHHSSLTVAPNGILWGTVSAYNTMAYGAVSREYIVGGKFTYQQQTYFFTNSAATNGVTPYGGVTLGLDGNFYGTTSAGGSSNYGTVFQQKTNGTFTSLMSFTSPTGPVNPQVGLTLGPDGNLYGVTQYGGSSNYGTVFQVTTNGVLTTLASFTFDNGAYPVASLTLGPDGNLYGTTPAGGSGGGGLFYRLIMPSLQPYSYIASPTNGLVPLMVQFSTTNMDNTGNAITAWNWTFGDGTTSTVQNPTHTYTTAGNFSPTLTVTNSLGLSITLSGLAISTYLPPPAIAGISLSGTDLILTGTNGIAGSTNYLLMSTNLTLPPNQWLLVATNIVSADGSFTNTVSNAADRTIPAQYYRLKAP